MGWPRHTERSRFPRLLYPCRPLAGTPEVPRRREGAVPPSQRRAWTEAKELALVWGDVEVVVGWLDSGFRDTFLHALAFLPRQVRCMRSRSSSGVLSQSLLGRSAQGVLGVACRRHSPVQRLEVKVDHLQLSSCCDGPSGVASFQPCIPK